MLLITYSALKLCYAIIIYVSVKSLLDMLIKILRDYLLRQSAVTCKCFKAQGRMEIILDCDMRCSICSKTSGLKSVDDSSGMVGVFVLYLISS